MDFGLQLATGTPKTILEMTKLAEQLGFHSVFVPDHFASEPPGGDGLDPNAPVWEAMTMLGAMAAATSKIHVGALVLCNLFRHPATTAQATATLDHISGGRAILGIGSGWTQAEFEMTGVPFPPIGPRLRQLDEALEIITSLWDNERTNFAGEFYQLREAFIAAKPLRRPPILLGGSGRGLLRIAARHADLVNIIVDTGRAGTVVLAEVSKLGEENFLRKVDFLRREAAGHGRTPQISTTGFVTILTATEEEADATVAAVAGGFGLEPAEARRMPIALVGTAGQWVEELKRRERDWGLTHMVLSGSMDRNSLERFGAEVLPHMSR